VIVYRVEHKEDNGGPYRSDRFLEKMEDVHSTDKRASHPTRSDDFRQHLEDGVMTAEEFDTCVCGFLSFALFSRWFKGFKRELKRAGFVLRLFETGHVFVGESERQIMFDREKAKLIGEKSVLCRN